MVTRTAFLERGPEAERMQHLDWNCFLNRFLSLFFFSVYFSHILTFLKMPWPKALKNAVLLNLNQGPLSVEALSWVFSGNWRRALGADGGGTRQPVTLRSSRGEEVYSAQRPLVNDGERNFKK